ncbi:kinase-like domain-containing protein [Gilbertella persicaria]|uniref:kinase-like domain-containing protein n=1 Tax=Gilbertella persicaria TaxID=101096 RepID=UPI0022202A91|nr:kinase-like domain-containing protein [Gilbertella persicaria]KAI8066278.1 kinase-like domain-containing protein [Gilbertella persicaria]
MMLSKAPLRKKRNFKNLTLPNSPVVVGSPPSSASLNESTDRSAIKTATNDYTQLCDQLSELEIGLELRLDLRPEDFKSIDELGRGNGGTVSKVLHIRTNTVMARKIVHIDANMNVRKQIMRELQFMHDCNSKHIVSFYGAFMNGGDISICMEYMDAGSLDQIYKKHGPFPLDVLKKVAYAIVDGLIYLYDEHRIIHRDLKPSNVLVNSQGQIKLCDFGVSGQLINSVADTFVGTSSYMSPERIMGSPYSVKSDVWSLGITLMELALGRFPFPPEGTPLSIFELLQHIVHEPVPVFPPNKEYPSDLTDFVALWYGYVCLDYVLILFILV